MTASALPLLATAGRPFLDTPPDELRAWLGQHGQPPMRLRQIRRWLFAGRAASFAQMTDLPLMLRNELARDFSLLGSTIARRQTASDGTEKLLIRLADAQVVEC